MKQFVVLVVILFMLEKEAVGQKGEWNFDSAVEFWQKRSCIYPDKSLYKAADVNGLAKLDQCHLLEHQDKSDTVDGVLRTELCQAFYRMTIAICDNEQWQAFVQGCLSPEIVGKGNLFAGNDVCSYIFGSVNYPKYFAFMKTQELCTRNCGAGMNSMKDICELYAFIIYQNEHRSTCNASAERQPLKEEDKPKSVTQGNGNKITITKESASSPTTSDQTEKTSTTHLAGARLLNTTLEAQPVTVNNTGYLSAARNNSISSPPVTEAQRSVNTSAQKKNESETSGLPKDEPKISPPSDDKGKTPEPSKDGPKISPPSDDKGKTLEPSKDEPKISPPSDDKGKTPEPSKDGPKISPPSDDKGKTPEPSKDGPKISPPSDDKGKTPEPSKDGPKISPPSDDKWKTPESSKDEPKISTSSDDKGKALESLLISKITSAAAQRTEPTWTSSQSGQSTNASSKERPPAEEEEELDNENSEGKDEIEGLPSDISEPGEDSENQSKGDKADKSKNKTPSDNKDVSKGKLPGFEPGRKQQQDGLEKKVGNLAGDAYDDSESSPGSGHFLAYFLTAVVICISGYVIYHNKQKILAFIIEGRNSGRNGRQRSKDVKYSQLKSSVEEVMPSLEQTATGKNFVY